MFQRPLSAWLIHLILVGCATSVGPDFDIQGHRGARGDRPENSLSAFRYATEIGVPTLEMDVVVSADSQIVVSHEPWMSRDLCLLPDGRRIAEDSARAIVLFTLPYEQIARYDCGSLPNEGFPDQIREPGPKPLLSDVIDAAEELAAKMDRPAVRYNIETKSNPSSDGLYHPDPETFVTLLVDVLTRTGILDRTTVQSFDVRTLQVLHARGIAVTTSFLIDGSKPLAAHLHALGFTPDILSPHRAIVSPALVDSAHSLGMKVVPWTINVPAEMRRQIAYGIDGLITDFPAVAMQLVGRERRSADRP